MIQKKNMMNMKKRKVKKDNNMKNLNNEIIIELLDQSKEIHKYKLLDIVLYNDVEYAVMLPEYTLDGMVEVFKMKHTEDKSATLYKAETNNYIIMQVYEMFKEKYQKYYNNRLTFTD